MSAALNFLQICVILLLVPHQVLTQPIHCDIFDTACKQQQHNFASATSIRANEQKPVRSKTRNCNFQDIWLIPGRADASCTRTDAKKLVDIDPRHVTIRPPVVKFPGCFTVEIKNVHIHDNEDVLSNSFFAKSEYQWLNVKEFGEVKCQNASSDGCVAMAITATTATSAKV
uniref:Uncharacterized protein n=1 Tax=Ditylenchus dipsaci TaxID=166011 RepID=A0A915E3J8_9BILA